MAIIFNLCSLAAGILCSFLWNHLKRSFSVSKVYAIKGYSWALLFLGFAFIVLSFPGLILFAPLTVQIDFILTDLLFFGSVLFFVTTTISFFEITLQAKKIVFFTFLFYILLYAFLSVIFFSPAVPLKTDDVIYYWKSGVPWIQGIARALFCLVGSLLTIFFLQKAKTVEKKVPSKKAFLLGISGLMVFAGGLIFWFLPFFYFSPKLLVLSGFLGFFGIVIGGVATFLFRRPQKLWVKKVIE